MYIDSRTGLLVVNIGNYSQIDDPAMPEHSQLMSCSNQMSCREQSPAPDDAVCAYPVSPSIKPEAVHTWNAEHPIYILAVGVDTIDSNRSKGDRPVSKLIWDKYKGYSRRFSLDGPKEHLSIFRDAIEHRFPEWHLDEHPMTLLDVRMFRDQSAKDLRSHR